MLRQMNLSQSSATPTPRRRRTGSRFAICAAALLAGSAVVTSDLVEAQTAPRGQGMPQGRQMPPGMRMPARPQPPKPLKRSQYLDAAKKQFAAGDLNRDGMIEIGELQEALEQITTRAINQRFERLDTDGNGSISSGEFHAWQKSLGAVALYETAAGEPQVMPNAIPVDLGSDREDLLIARLLVPLTATAIVDANRNYDGGATLEEFLAYQAKQFDALDLDGNEQLLMNELRQARRDLVEGVPNGLPTPEARQLDYEQESSRSMLMSVSYEGQDANGSNSTASSKKIHESDRIDWDQLTAQQRDRLKRLDTNGNDMIEVEELPDRARRIFERADTDGNGVLSMEELRALQAMRQRR